MKIEKQRGASGSYRDGQPTLVISVPAREVKQLKRTSVFVQLLAFFASPMSWIASLVVGAVFGAIFVPLLWAIDGWSLWKSGLASWLLGLLTTLIVVLKEMQLDEPQWKQVSTSNQTLHVTREALATNDGETIPLDRVRVVEVRPADNGTMRVVALDDVGEHELLTDLSPDEACRAKEAIDDFG